VTRVLGAWISWLLLISCSAAQSAATPTSVGAGRFVDVTAASGVQFLGRASHTSHKYLPETMGSGVALFDYDNDGRLDIFLVNGAPLVDPTPLGALPRKTGPAYWNRLYHQKEDGTFEDVTEKAGLQGVNYDMGVAVGDYDNDGFEDLYVTGYGGNHLYHNNGNGTFTDVTRQSGTGADGWSTSAAWVDLDNDGRLDLVVLRYLKWDFDDLWCGEHQPGYRSYCHPDVFQAVGPLVYHNNGNGTFTEISAKVGIDKAGKGLGIAVADYDLDGRVDLMVANDSMVEYLYHQKPDGTFEENGLMADVAVDSDGRTYAGMGVDFQDYDNDGLPDLVITDLANQKYAVYRNNGDASFNYATNVSAMGVATMLHSGWGVKFLDYDNDGLKDLVIAQGHDIDNIQLTFPQLRYKEPMLLMRNVGGGKFQDVSAESGDVFKQAWAGRGLAVGDLNNDGLEDLVVTTNDGPAYVIRNVTPTKNHWLGLELIGHKSNRDAVGAVIKLSTSRGSQWWTVSTSGSYLSASDKRVHFGLGIDSEAKSIQISWPSGIRQDLRDVKGDQVLRVDEPVNQTKR
jgi:enediyne biosynthesis protein E4